MKFNYNKGYIIYKTILNHKEFGPNNPFWNVFNRFFKEVMNRHKTMALSIEDWKDIYDKGFRIYFNIPVNERNEGDYDFANCLQKIYRTMRIQR